MHLKYSIAFCYTQLAEVEGDVSLYSKAEAAATECYETAINPSNQADALYLWGYILFKQARYEEAGAKFKALLETFLEVDALFALGKVYLELGDKAAARQTFAQLKQRIETIKQRTSSRVYTAEVLYGLGKVYLEFGDKAAAQSVFAQHLKDAPDSAYRLEIERLLEKQ
jgi:tetratricopeptide (TPR) repeat protein